MYVCVYNVCMHVYMYVCVCMHSRCPLASIARYLAVQPAHFIALLVNIKFAICLFDDADVFGVLFPPPSPPADP